MLADPHMRSVDASMLIDLGRGPSVSGAHPLRIRWVCEGQPAAALRIHPPSSFPVRTSISRVREPSSRKDDQEQRTRAKDAEGDPIIVGKRRQKRMHII